MTLEKLKEYADEKNITIIDGVLKNKKAFAFADDEQKAIVMDSLCFAFLYTSPIF